MSRMKMATRDKCWLLIVLAIATAVRGVYLFAFGSSVFSDIFFADHLYYREWALRIFSGDLLGNSVFEQGPLYAYGLALVYRFLGTGTIPVIVAQMAIGLVTIALLFACTRLIAGSRAALVAGLLSAVYGPFVFYESLVMKSFLEPFLVIAALYGCLRYAENHHPGWLAFSGCSLGLACLVREVYFLFLPAMLFWSLREGAGGLPVRRRLRIAALAGMGFLIITLPVTLRNYLVGHELTAVTNGGGEAFYIAFGPYAGPYYTPPPFIRTEPGLEHEDFRDEARLITGRMLTPAEASRFWFVEGLKTIVASPPRALKLIGLRARIIGHDFEPPDSESFTVTREKVTFLGYLISFGWIAGLGLLGIVIAVRLPGRTLLLGAIAVAVLGVLLSYPFSRFRLTIAALWLIAAGVGVDWILSKWKRTPETAVVAALCAGLVSFWSFRPPPYTGGWMQATEEYYREDLQVKMAHKKIIPRIESELVKHPLDPQLYDAMASQYEEIGKLHEAANMYRRALDLDPNLESANWRLVNVLFKQGNYEDAYLQARSFAARYPTNAEGHMMLGVFAMKQAIRHHGEDRRKLVEESELHLDEAVRLSPRSPLAHYYRGKVQALLGDVEIALREIEAALVIEPSFPEAVHLREILRTRLDRI